jgi:hypothetical protein
MNAPAATKAPIHGLTVTAPTTPIAAAPPTETAASAMSTRDGICVLSGRPFSSSRAWAPTPTARPNARSVGQSLAQANAELSAAPIAT